MRLHISKLVGGVVLSSALTLSTLAPVTAQDGPFGDLMNQDFSTPYQRNADDFSGDFSEAPMLTEMVEAGQLPPLAERLPANPPVVIPYESEGRYGGNVVKHLHNLSLWWLAARQLGHADLVRQQAGNSGEFEVDLAERWEVSDDSTVWTFYLREGLRWSDGEPFTTADLMFWYEHVLQNDNLMPGKPAYWRPGGELVQMEALDDLTIQLTFAQSHPLFLLGLTEEYSISDGGWANWANQPAHYMRQFHPDFTSEDELNARVAELGVGGWPDLYVREVHAHTASPGRPYMIPFVPDGPAAADGQWSWTRNAYYYKVDEQGQQLPYLDTFEFVQITDNQALLLATIGGEFDLVHTFMRADSLPSILDAINNRGAELQVIPNLNAKTGEVAIYMNYTVDDPALREIFNDVRFRQAVSLAVNREEISEARFRGFSQPGQAGFPPVDPYVFDEEWVNAFIEYDPAEANVLLDEMGLAERDNEGFRLRSDGERLTIIMEFRAGNHAQAIELLPEYMADVGIELSLRPSASALYRERTQDNSIQWAGWSMQPSFYSLWALIPGAVDQTPHRPFGVLWSQWYYTDGAQGEEPTGDMREMIDLVDAAQTAQSIEERAELVSAAGRLHRENLWVIGLAGMDIRPHVAHSDLRNIPPAPYGLNTDPSAHSQYPEQWFWDR